MIRIIFGVFVVSCVAQGQVSYNRIVHALGEPQNWLTYYGDYSGRRYRDLNQIDIENVRDLRVEWIYQTGRGGTLETVPLVVDGVMYVTAGDGIAMALDALTGRELWKYTYAPPPDRKISGVNRGFAILGDRLFMVTPDSNVIALETRTGKLVWQTEMAPYKAGLHYATVAPLAIDGKIITGISGGESGVRGFIDAYDATTGKRCWRFWTIPLKGEPGGDTWEADSAQRGGGPTWLTGTYDPDSKTLFWGVGNPGPDLYGDVRKGDNLYSSSIVALDADSGHLKWYFQCTPHDTHDWDATEVPVLLDLRWQGASRKLLVQANRNGFYYVLDRETGQFLHGNAFTKQTWAKGLDQRGRPIPLPHSEPSPEGTRLCPGLSGGANWMAPSYNPATKLLYVQVRQQCDVFYSEPPAYIEGKSYWGSVFRGVTDEKESGVLQAIDPLTGATQWTFSYYRAPWAGTLTTSGGLVFSGDEDGYFMALDAQTGKNLWRINTGSRLVTAPITYRIAGRQYVTMPSGGALFTFALPQ